MTAFRNKASNQAGTYKATSAGDQPIHAHFTFR
jgi:hypothetical protein